MQKQAPSVGRILAAVGFALSCFGLLLFLWITFGGPTPLKAKSYRFTADFPEAVTLAKEADVRMGGVSVGKVKALSLPEDANATEVEIELLPKFAPIPSDARAILRQKTLLGETFIELTGGTEDAPPVPDGGELARAATQDSTQIDEIFQALDPETRSAFQSWIQNSAIAIKGRGQDLSNAFGNLGPFTTDATAILRILNEQDKSLQGLVRDTGRVFEALSARDTQLATAITGSNTTFRALASRDAALAESIQILPVFQRETRLTLNRLAEFAKDTHPLVRDLKPVASDLTPTLERVRELSPHLRDLFVNLKPLLRVSKPGLPALRKTLESLRPVLAALDPFLANLNPVVRYLNAYKTSASDFLANPASGFSVASPIPGQPAIRRTLRQEAYISAESLSIYPMRLTTNRGNGYLGPDIVDFSIRHLIFPNFDCKNTPTGGEYAGNGDASAPCYVAPDFPEIFGGGQAPNIYADP